MWHIFAYLPDGTKFSCGNLLAKCSQPYSTGKHKFWIILNDFCRRAMERADASRVHQFGLGRLRSSGVKSI